MAPVFRFKPDDTQTLLLCDDAREDLEGHGGSFSLRNSKVSIYRLLRNSPSHLMDVELRWGTFNSKSQRTF